MFTACTMASAVEAMGMALPGTASHPAMTYQDTRAVPDQKREDCVAVAKVGQSKLGNP